MKNKNFFLFASLTILFSSIIIEFYQFSSILNFFPFGDVGIQVARLHFLKTYGFHGNVLNWYNGFTLFKFYPPGWFFFALPLYNLLGNILVATYLSLISIFILAILIIYKSRKFINLSRTESIAFFILFFGSPIFLSYFDIGRLPEIFAWLTFIPFFITIFYYKDRRIDSKFFLIVLFFSLVLLSHIFVFVLASILLFSLFLIKSNKEKMLIVSSGILSMIITSFWWIPFLAVRKGPSFQRGIFYYSVASELLSKTSIISFNTLVLLAWFVVISIYIYRTKKIAFYLPSTILSILLITRLVIFVPVIRDLPASPYTLYFLFLTIYLFLELKLYRNNLFLIALLLLSISSIILITINHRDYPTLSSQDKEILNITPRIEENYMFLFDYNDRIDAYSAIYYNLSTTGGGFRAAVSDKPGYLEKLEEVKKELDSKECFKLKQDLEDLKVKEVIVQRQKSEFLKKCGYLEKFSTENFSLFTAPN